MDSGGGVGPLAELATTYGQHLPRARTFLTGRRARRSRASLARRSLLRRSTRVPGAFRPHCGLVLGASRPSDQLGAGPPGLRRPSSARATSFPPLACRRRLSISMNRSRGAAGACALHVAAREAHRPGAASRRVAGAAPRVVAARANEGRWGRVASEAMAAAAPHDAHCSPASCTGCQQGRTRPPRAPGSSFRRVRRASRTSRSSQTTAAAPRP